MVCDLSANCHLIKVLVDQATPRGCHTYLSQEDLQHRGDVIGADVNQVNEVGATFEALQQLLDTRRHAGHAVDAGPLQRPTLNLLGALAHQNGHHLVLGQRLDVLVEDAALRAQGGVRTHDGQLLQAFLVADQLTLCEKVRQR